MRKSNANSSVAAPGRATPEIRILIVDDHELMRTGLRDLIHTCEDWRVCGEASREDDAFEQFRQQAPDLAIVDLSLEEGNGLDLIRRIRRLQLATRILVLSMHDENLYAERALRAGADGFASKQQPSREVMQAIRTILTGEVYLSERMSGVLLHRIARGSATCDRSPFEHLSDRELEIFTLIGQGLTTSQVAERLHLSPNTVGTYRERLKAKLTLKSSTELSRAATQWALENR